MWKTMMNSGSLIADIDGTNAEIVVPDVYYAVAADTKNGKIYFDDQNEGWRFGMGKPDGK